MNVFKIMQRHLPTYFKDVKITNLYKTLDALPLAAKKNASRIYLTENRRLRDDYRYTHGSDAKNVVKRSFRDYKTEKILYKTRRDVCERLQKRCDLRCAMAKCVKLPKGVNVHHVHGDMDDHKNIRVMSKRAHIKLHVKQRSQQRRLQQKNNAVHLFEF